MDVDVLRGHQQHGGEGAAVHLGHGDGEDEQPGDGAGQAVDQRQGRVGQRQPHIGADTPLDATHTTHVNPEYL